MKAAPWREPTMPEFVRGEEHREYQLSPTATQGENAVIGLNQWARAIGDERHRLNAFAAAVAVLAIERPAFWSDWLNVVSGRLRERTKTGENHRLMQADVRALVQAIEAPIGPDGRSLPQRLYVAHDPGDLDPPV